MKKILPAVLALSVFLSAAPELRAQSKPLGASLNWGIVTDTSFDFRPFVWTGCFELDFFLGPSLSISPEAGFIVRALDFSSFILAAGVIVNLHTDAFYLGGGLTQWWLAGSEAPEGIHTDFMLKINAGFKISNLKFGAYVVTPFDGLFSDPVVALTWGFYF